MGQEGIDNDNEAVAVAVPMKSNSSVTAPPGSSVMSPPGANTSKSLAVPAGNSSSNIPMWQQEKQGAKCCGCCCDYRRAVIVIAIVNICLALGSIIVSLVAASPSVATQFDDDTLLEILNDSARTQAIFSGVSMFCSICALVGANKYNIPLVAIATLWYVGAFIASTITNLQATDEVNTQADDDFTSISFIPTIVIDAIVTCIFMYPYIGFMYEVKTGIMSYETYPREEFSCCCAPGARRG